jgi:hypothetical protein|nr:hypothetical protein [Kofleriaceae bacterium]
MPKLLAVAVVAMLGGSAGCTAHADLYTGPVHVESASLVPLSPGSEVSTLADSDQPIFATEHAYWLVRGGTWYRADDYRRGPWVHISNPPERLRRIAHPMAYVHFRRHDDSAAMILLRH